MTSALPPILPAPTIYGGDAAVWPSFTFKDSGGTAIDLVAAGWTGWEAQWRLTPDAVTYLALNVDASAASSGTIVLSAPGNITAQMLAGGFWDVRAFNNGVPETWARGRTLYVQGVTRDV